MELFDSIERLINEHGSAAILGKQLDLAKDQFIMLERKVFELERKALELQGQVEKFQAQLEIERLNHKETKQENERLNKELEENVFISHGIEFRRGRRTGKKWLPFCPKSHLPISYKPDEECKNPMCSDRSTCRWSCNEECISMPSWISELPK